MLNESRRREFLGAMQVVHWLPRTELPFAAPSRPEWSAQPGPLVEPACAESPLPPVVPAKPSIERTKVAVSRPVVKPAVEPEAAAALVPKVVTLPPPRFSLQLLRAGACLILADLPTGEAFQSRDPSYLLLKDLLRAAGLPDNPQILGEPIRWPLLQRGNIDQGPDAARDFVQGFVMVHQEETPSVCLWLVGLAAVRFAGEANAQDYDRELQVEGLGNAWALPGLELLMDEPQRKASLWQAMRRLMSCWKNRDE